MALGITTAYAQLPPCVDAYGHKFVANNAGYVCCERCGIAPSKRQGF